MHRYNPFKPGVIVHPAMFAGRLEELEAFDKALFQTKNGNPAHFLIHGERGIGKSSLLLYLDYLAQGNISSLTDQRYSFITSTIELEIGNKYSDIVRKIGSELSRTIKGHDKIKSLMKQGWEFLTRWEAFSVKYNRTVTKESKSELFEDLCDTVCQVAKKIQSQSDGMVILIDEADKPSQDAHLGEFVKVFTERLSRQSCNNVMIVLSGISNVIENMRLSHESSLRVFTQYELLPLPLNEAEDIIYKGLAEANEKNREQVSIEKDAANWIADRGSQGYPHFIQEYSYFAFDADTDCNIDMSDLSSGVYRENGALAQLGKKYFENMYLAQINSDDYRKVLQVMSEHMDDFVTKQQLRDGTRLKEYTLNNAISAMKQRSIIIPNIRRRGEYRLPSKSFAIWIKTYSAERK